MNVNVNEARLITDWSRTAVDRARAEKSPIEYAEHAILAEANAGQECVTTAYATVADAIRVQDELRERGFHAVAVRGYGVGEGAGFAVFAGWHDPVDAESDAVADVGVATTS